MIKRIFKWIGILILIVLLTIGLFVFNTYSQFDKLEQGQLQENFKGDIIPFRYSNSGHILIDVKVNNSDRAYPFILDSGANSYVFKNFTKEHPLEGNGFAFSIGATDNMFFSRIRKVQSLQIGRTIFKALNVAESALHWDCMDDVYGLIGANTMRHLVWNIDFQKKIIVLSENIDNSHQNGQAIEIPVTESKFGHFLNVDLKFRHNRISKKVKIDFGNSGTLSIRENLLIEDGLNFEKKKILGVASKGLGYAMNNKNFDGSYYLVDSLIFNQSDYSVSNIPVNASPSSFNFLGLGFFKKYNVTISWKDKMVILSPIDSVQNFVSKTYGFSTGYNEMQNKVEIKRITENTPASRAGVPLLSEVVSINQKTFTTSESYCAFKELEFEGDTMSIEIKHNDSIRLFQLTKEFLFD